MRLSKVLEVPVNITTRMPGRYENRDAEDVTPFTVVGCSSSNAGGVSAPLPGPNHRLPEPTRPSPRPLLLSPCQNKAAVYSAESLSPAAWGAEPPTRAVKLDAPGCLKPLGRENSKKAVLKLSRRARRLGCHLARPCLHPKRPGSRFR